MEKQAEAKEADGRKQFEAAQAHSDAILADLAASFRGDMVMWNILRGQKDRLQAGALLRMRRAGQRASPCN